MNEDTRELNNDATIILKLPEKHKNKFQDSTDNMAGTLRRLIYNYLKIEDRYDVGDDMEKMNAILLNTYKNAVEQNIQLMKSQKAVLEEELEEYEDEEENEVLYEVDLDVAKKNL